MKWVGAIRVDGLDGHQVRPRWQWSETVEWVMRVLCEMVVHHDMSQ